MWTLYGIFALNNSRFIEYFDCICLPEIELRDTTNAARSTSYIERSSFNKRVYSNFLVVHFPFICSNIQTAPGDGLYVYQLKRCSASCGSPSFFNYPLSSLCHEWTLICSVCTYCRSFLRSWLICLWHMNGCWHGQHDESHLWNRTLFTILIFCIQLQF